jgi:hypothetical protein
MPRGPKAGTQERRNAELQGMLSLARKDGLSADGLKCAAAQLRGVHRSEKSEAIRRGAERALEMMKAKRERAAVATATTTKADKRRRKDGAVRREDRSFINSVVGPEVRRHGDYQAVDFQLHDVEEGSGSKAKAKAKSIRVIRNVGGSPVERWFNRGRLTEREMAAVLFYQSAWAAWIGEPRVTANYSPAVSRNAHGAVELWASSRIRAKESLRLLDQEVFFRIPVEHFHVWQNVVIWDEPAGIAGGRAGFVSTKQSEAAARLIVCLVAKMIADVVIDSSRSDFGELLLDLDAARRPGRRG